MIAAVEPLDERHDLTQFQSGSPDFDRWLIDHSATARGQGVRTYIALDDEGNAIGYFAIAPHAVERSELPSRIARGAPSRIPAVLLAKLARDVRYRGVGLGSELLVEALVVIVGAARQVGGASSSSMPSTMPPSTFMRPTTLSLCRRPSSASA